MNKIKFAAYSMIVALGLGLSAMNIASAAAPAAAKPVSCKQEAKEKGIKDTKEASTYVKKCKKERAAAKKQAK